MNAIRRCVWLGIGLLYVLGCATVPEPPDPSRPYAVLKFPASMRLIAVDKQALKPAKRIDTMWMTPGPHTLRFVHVNAGIDGSAEHAGQIAAPFALDAHAGMVYQFESKT